MLKKIISPALVLILALGAGFYIYFGSFVTVPGVSAPESSASRPVITTINAKIPDLDRPTIIPDGWPADAKEMIKIKIESLVSGLKKNPDSFDNWLDLGIQRKAINDYEGAGECWEYAGAIRPLNYVSYNNLGELYGYYLKDYKKAEENYLTAIKNGPDQIYIYRNVYEFYRNVMKDDIKMKAILGKGITANPNTSQDLKYLLDNF